MVCVEERLTEIRVRFSINRFLDFVHLPGIDVPNRSESYGNWISFCPQVEK
jgi:hypothetical protein